LVDSPVNVVEKGEAPWAPELPEPESELVTVARFVDPFEAALAKNCLEAAGFPAFLADAKTVSMAWQLSNALGGIKLQVAEPDAQKARLVLQEQLDGSTAEQEELVREAISTSPEEEGSDEYDPQPTSREKDAERAFRGAVFGLLFFPLEFYALYLLSVVLFSSERLAGRSRTRALIAAAINLTYLLVLMLGGSVILSISR
jgi:hypothetical protein